MFIQESLKNIRCDTISCHKLAQYNICTSSYKGNIYMCDDCFNKLHSAIQSIKKEKTNKKKKEKEDN